ADRCNVHCVTVMDGLVYITRASLIITCGLLSLRHWWRTVLFPYTTLFRSSVHPYFQSIEGMQVSTHLLILRSGEVLQFVKSADGDRKSTRLNSSHVKSSYAVFCLKEEVLA